jgi:uncharacterized protein (TIGR02001 family)
MRSFHRALAGAAFLAAGLAGTAASAQTPAPAAPAPAPPTPFYDALGPISIAWNVGVANDYAFRGVSQTKENTSVFAGVDASYKEFYLGAWQSNVNFKPFGDNDTDHEIDLYGGWKPTVAGVELDVGFIYYAYSNQPSYLPDVDYIEGYIKASKAFGPVTVGGSFFYSPEFTGHTGDAEYYEGNLSWAVDKKLTVSGAVGRQEIEKASGYTTWNAGVTYALIDHVSVDLRYWDTDEHGFGKVYGSRFIAGLKYSF